MFFNLRNISFCRCSARPRRPPTISLLEGAGSNLGPGNHHRFDIAKVQ